MSVTRETSHSPISPQGSLEFTTLDNSRQSPTAILRRSLDSKETNSAEKGERKSEMSWRGAYEEARCDGHACGVNNYVDTHMYMCLNTHTHT